MAARLVALASVAAAIRERAASPTPLVAIDGPGGAGKTTLARRLARALGDAPVVHTDDFSTGDEDDPWWQRLEAQVIRPLAAGEQARYRRWDWQARRLAETRVVAPGSVVLIEGVGSARLAAAPSLAYAIWVDAPRAIRLRRGLARDGDAARDQWERWLAEEDDHFARDGTCGRADLVVDGAPLLAHDSYLALVVLDRPRIA